MAGIWHKNEIYRIEQTKQVQGRITKLEEQKSVQVVSLGIHPDLADEIKAEVLKLKAEITQLETQAHTLSSVDRQLEDFTYYAIDYTENLRKKWWELPPDRKEECKQLVFKGQIFIEMSG